jgi:MoxR-like ATPase
LPEAQLDRFVLRIRLGYPSAMQEMHIMDLQQYRHPLEELAQVMEVQTLLDAQEAVKAVYVDEKVKTYIVDLVTATRKHSDVHLGASPRGSLVLYRTAQARAALAQRDYVLPDDVKYLAPQCLAHRMIISPSARIKDVSAEAIVAEILQSIPVPGAVAGRK